MTQDEQLTALLDGARVAGPTSTRRCRMGAILDTVSPANRDTLAQRMAGTMPAWQIARILTAAGYPIGETTLRAHRADRCTCEATE